MHVLLCCLQSKVQCSRGKTCHLGPQWQSKASQSLGRYTFCSLLCCTPSPCNCRVLLKPRVIFAAFKSWAWHTFKCGGERVHYGSLDNNLDYIAFPCQASSVNCFMFNYIKFLILSQTDHLFRIVMRDEVLTWLPVTLNLLHKLICISTMIGCWIFYAHLIGC